MRIGIIANRKYRDWLIDVFSNYSSNYTITGFYSVHHSEEGCCQGIPVIDMSQMSNDNDAFVIAVDSAQLFDEIQDKLFEVYPECVNVCVIRPLSMDKRSDFLIDRKTLNFAHISPDRRYTFCLERSVWYWDEEKKDRVLLDLNAFSEDLSKWKNKVSDIGMFRLRGNDPLVESGHMIEIIEKYRRIFPDSEIRVRTGAKSEIPECIAQHLKNLDVVVECNAGLDGNINCCGMLDVLVKHNIEHVAWTWEKREAYLETELNRTRNYYNSRYIEEKKNYIEEKKQRNDLLNKLRRRPTVLKLLDCFSAGYSMPQYCFDHNYCHPLFVGDDFELLWQIYVQFLFDKRMSPKFSSEDDQNICVCHSEGYLYAGELTIVPVSSVNFDEYDLIIYFGYKNPFETLTDKVISADELLQSIQNYVYNVRPFEAFSADNPGVKIVLMNHPSLETVSDLGEEGEKVIHRNVHDLYLKINEDNYSGEYVPFSSLGYTVEETRKLLNRPNEDMLTDGSSRYSDDPDDIINISNGRRKTDGQISKRYKHRIYCIGICAMYGYGAPWNKTIESYLQKLLNESGFEYIVINEGMFLTNRAQDLFYNLRKLDVVSGDIVIAMMPHINECNEFPFIDVSGMFDDMNNIDLMFADKGHLTEMGYDILAKKIFSFLLNNGLFENEYINHFSSLPYPHRYGIISRCYNNIPNDKLTEYKSSIRKKKAKIGAIVANCNPFTCGHRYLIEYAVSMVDRLYVFVVEEDKSLFSFEDRLKMVELGTRDLDKVSILPTGMFIVSMTTFREYFNKDITSDQTIDVVMDLSIFALEIAPELGINIRFVGEEPNDSVTKQYNDQMKDILPKQNNPIEVIEIPRLMKNGNYVSAKLVRKEIEKGNLISVKEYVPLSTYKYLSSLYNWSDDGK